MSATERASLLKPGDRIMWAGYRCIVQRAERELRRPHQHRIYMVVDLSVPDRPDANGLRYATDEQVETWEDDQ